MTTTPPIAHDSPYGADLDVEHRRWHEITALCRSLSPDERERPGYYSDHDWTVKDLVAHLGMWFAEADLQLQRIRAGTYEEQPLDVDARNAEALDALREQSWSTVWSQAHAARTLMLATWADLDKRSDAADFWTRKAGAEHEGQHLERLHVWVAELQAARA